MIFMAGTRRPGRLKDTFTDDLKVLARKIVSGNGFWKLTFKILMGNVVTLLVTRTET